MQNTMEMFLSFSKTIRRSYMNMHEFLSLFQIPAVPVSSFATATSLIKSHIIKLNRMARVIVPMLPLCNESPQTKGCVNKFAQLAFWVGFWLNKDSLAKHSKHYAVSSHKISSIRKEIFPLQCLSSLEFSASAAENLNTQKSTLLLECETGSSSQTFRKTYLLVFLMRKLNTPPVLAGPF